VLIKINGKTSEVSNHLSVLDLISTRDLRDKAVVIELNGTVIQRASWEDIKLNPDDSLEIIRLMGGG
jgi:thiamine biosynthesis protein ThiS